MKKDSTPPEDPTMDLKVNASEFIEAVTLILSKSPPPKNTDPELTGDALKAFESFQSTALALAVR